MTQKSNLFDLLLNKATIDKIENVRKSWRIAPENLGTHPTKLFDGDDPKQIVRVPHCDAESHFFSGRTTPADYKLGIPPFASLASNRSGIELTTVSRGEDGEILPHFLECLSKGEAGRDEFYDAVSQAFSNQVKNIIKAAHKTFFSRDNKDFDNETKMAVLDKAASVHTFDRKEIDKIFDALTSVEPVVPEEAIGTKAVIAVDSKGISREFELLPSAKASYAVAVAKDDIDSHRIKVFQKIKKEKLRGKNPVLAKELIASTRQTNRFFVKLPVGGAQPQNIGSIANATTPNTRRGYIVALRMTPPQRRRPSNAQKILYALKCGRPLHNLVDLDRQTLFAYGARARLDVNLRSHIDAEDAEAREIAREYCDGLASVRAALADIDLPLALSGTQFERQSAVYREFVLSDFAPEKSTVIELAVEIARPLCGRIARMENEESRTSLPLPGRADMAMTENFAIELRRIAR
ncbi:MAG: hypothetical protein ING19_21645 [Azospirillum sp.]|nr:hypothetical protein [Azospirillum sp.]